MYNSPFFDSQIIGVDTYCRLFFVETWEKWSHPTGRRGLGVGWRKRLCSACGLFAGEGFDFLQAALHVGMAHEELPDEAGTVVLNHDRYGCLVQAHEKR